MEEQEWVVKAHWTTYGEYRIKANSAEEAMKIASGLEQFPDEDTGVGDIHITDAIPASDPMEDGEDPA